MKLPTEARLRQLIEKNNIKALREFCETGHPAAVAEMLSGLNKQEAWTVLRNVDFPVRAEIFSHLDEDFGAKIIGILKRDEAAHLLSDMPPDDRADLFKRLPEEIRESVLPSLAKAEREDIRRLAAYQEGTAGAVMTSDYAMLLPHLTAVDAIDHLRHVAPDRETIYYAYVVDENRKLLGFVSLKDLILARRDAKVGDLMNRDFIFARTDEDQESAADKIQKYDLIALPVVTDEETLVGIITHDDAMDIITQEYTEDMEKFMAIAGPHEDAVYMKTSSWVHFKNRSIWVAMLAVVGLVSGFIVQSFEGILMQVALLAAFMPMLADTGGNTGSQSAILVIRALAQKEVSPRDIFRVLIKEFRVGLLLALILAAIAFVRVLLLSGGTQIPDHFSLSRIGLAVSLALGLQVITATLIGAMLPLGAARLKLDPAVVASPALTTFVDITGLLIYFMTVKWVLGM
ncbi:MAG TPA: magnesium transporter [bacterium]|nr:magnesium transporter [bacterium]